MLTYHFPPDGSVGGLRWSGISKFLVSRGWDIDVITAAPESAEGSPDGVFVHYCAPARTPNHVYNALARRVRSLTQRASSPITAANASASGGNGVALDGNVRDRRSLRASLSKALAFPDYGQGWILPAARLARKHIGSNEFDAIVTSGPPHSAHLAGFLACVGTRNRPWVDMRDPWAIPKGKLTESGVDAPRDRSAAAYLERFVLGRARGIITNTAEFAATIHARYPAASVTCITNGIDPSRLPAPASKFDGFSIAYAGTLYLKRDLVPIVEAIRDLLTRHPEAASGIKLRVAGDMIAELQARFHAAVTSNHLESVVETRGRVNTAEAMDLLNRSHLALVLAQGQPTQIPAKLYECTAMGLPTLVIAESESATAREGRRIGAMVCEPTDVVGMRTVIEDLWSGRYQPGGSPVSVGYDSIAAEVDRLLTNTA